MLTRKVGIIISRNEMTKIPKVVFAHEIRILRKIHGPDTVSLDQGQEPYGDEDINGEQELERLQIAYGMNKDVPSPNVELCYGTDGPDQIARRGMEDLEQMIAEAQPMGQQPAVNIDPGDMTKDAIVKYLNNLGVEFDAADTKDALANELRIAWGMQPVTPADEEPVEAMV